MSEQREPITPVSPPGSNNSGHVAIEAAGFAPSAQEQQSGIPAWQLYVGGFVIVAAAIFWFLFTTKSVQITFTPAAQSVAISGGLSFELGGVFLLREGQYEVQAEADLHEPLKTTIEVAQERYQSIDLPFIPLPGELQLDITPADAEVEVDGVGVAAKAGEMLTLAAGEHDILVRHPRYQSSKQTVQIEGKRIVQALNIALLPNWADVEVSSDPAGAMVLIDGEDSGLTTPTTIAAMAGEREISLELDGYRTHRERIFAQAQLPMTLDTAQLVQADARLRLTSRPAGAGVTVNGRFTGQTPITLDLKSGVAQRVAVILNGYSTYQRTLRLERGAKSDLNVDLTRQLGEVVVQVVPETAKLSVNGVERGNANQTLRLPISAQQLSISLPGYAGYTQTITPRVGLTQEIKVKLLTLEEARLAALTPTINAASGQTLRLFEPFAFKMGASRREPGRRANETLRDVAMSRLFYLATTEVTNAQFRQFASGHDSQVYAETNLNEAQAPAVNLSWHDAAAYCNWLSDRDNLPHYYRIEFAKVVGINPQATGYRLPTEAEWEWAARAGTSTTEEQLRFPWGRSLPPPDRHGNYADRSASHLVGRVIFGYNDNYSAAAPVGTYRANHKGLFDMGGNVAEWTNDFYEIPGKDAVSNPQGPAAGEYHVIKGSSWMHGTITELRYSFRDYGIDARADVGFRIARNAES
ncbi:MAG: PEGA domain-containing protein [Pseudomonadota bacterium]